MNFLKKNENVEKMKLLKTIKILNKKTISNIYEISSFFFEVSKSYKTLIFK